MAKVDIWQANEFLTRLGSVHSFQTFCDRTKDRRLARIFHGTFESCLPDLLRLHDMGAGVHVMVNQGNLRGKGKGDVIGVRSIFLDLDGQPLRNWPIRPSCVVLSSISEATPHYHVYWHVSDDFPLYLFPIYQDILAEYYSSDPQVGNLNRNMRVPGFLHRKSEPFLSRIVELHGTIYTPEEIAEAFPFVERIHRIRELENAMTQRARQTKVFSNDDHTPAIQHCVEALINHKEKQRNETLNAKAYWLNTLGLSYEEIHNALYDVAFSIGLEPHEIVSTLQSACKRGKAA